MNAIKSGCILEKLVHQELNKISNVIITPQYKYGYFLVREQELIFL
jgi:hypothetical protein